MCPPNIWRKWIHYAGKQDPPFNVSLRWFYTIFQWVVCTMPHGGARHVHHWHPDLLRAMLIWADRGILADLFPLCGWSQN